MVNNSININKTKESLNIDGQQFHQYQQNKQLKSLNMKKRPQNMIVEIQVWARDRHNSVAELNWLIGWTNM